MLFIIQPICIKNANCFNTCDLIVHFCQTYLFEKKIHRLSACSQEGTIQGLCVHTCGPYHTSWYAYGTRKQHTSLSFLDTRIWHINEILDKNCNTCADGTRVT